MVVSWPMPPDPARTRRICRPLSVENGIAGPVLANDRIVGSMGITREAGSRFSLGYMFHPDHWGRGYATEMGHSLIAAVFARYDAEQIVAGSFLDNPASARVLEKLGFRKADIARHYSAGRDAAAPCLNWVLTRKTWLAANPLHLETDRLMIRALLPADLEAFHAIASQADVARKMASVPHPLTKAAARGWIAKRGYLGRVGFSVAITSKQGGFLGVCGIGGSPVSVMYFIDPAQHGHGYATEGLRAFLRFAFDRFALPEITAQALHSNRASQRVLEKLGFSYARDVEFRRDGQLEPDLDYEYRLTLEQFEAAT